MGVVPVNVTVNGVQGQTAWSATNCGGGPVNITGAMTSWWTNDTTIATASNANVYGVAVGSTDNLAEGEISISGFRRCSEQLGKGSGGTNVVKAVPVNFKITGASDQGQGALPLLQATFAWQSSSGNMQDLSNCSMREYVTYPNTNNSACPNNSPAGLCYYPPSPPWPASGQAGTGYPNPTSPTPGPADGGASKDNNPVTNLNFVKPYSTNSFAATQYTQYSCDSGTTWTSIYGPITITRSMSQNSSQKWVVTVSRSDTTVTSPFVIPGQ